MEILAVLMGLLCFYIACALMCKVESWGIACIFLILGIIMFASPFIDDWYTNRQLEADGRIVTVTAQTNLESAGWELNVGNKVEIDFVTPVNPVSVGDVVSFYDTNGCPQVGIVNSINDDNTATIFMNDYAANGTVNVSMQYIYGIVTGRHYDW